MKLKTSYLLIIVVLILNGCNKTNHATLEKAIQSKWETPIEILNKNEDLKLVLYLDQDQYVLGEYKFNNNKELYNYDGENSIGHRISKRNNIPIFVKGHNFQDKGEVIFGAIATETHKAMTFIIYYENGDTQEVPAINNSFISIPLNNDESIKGINANIVNIKALDKDGNKITELQ